MVTAQGEVLAVMVSYVPATDGGSLNAAHERDVRSEVCRMASACVDWLHFLQCFQANLAAAHLRVHAHQFGRQVPPLRWSQWQETLSTDLFGADMLRAAAREQVAFMSYTESEPVPTRRSGR